MLRLLTSPISILFIILICFGITYFGLNYFAVPHSTQISPDGNYSIEVYQYPVIGAFIGEINDGPGFYILKDTVSQTQVRKPLRAVSLSDSITWQFTSVCIGADTLPLIDTYPIQKGHADSYAENHLKPAIQQSNVELTEKILRKGAAFSGHEHLETAVINRDSAMITLLLNQPGYLDYVNTLATNVLNDSKLLGDTATTKLLIDLGVSTNFTSRQGNSPLLAAVSGEHSETIIMLLKSSVNASCYTGESRTLFLESDRKFQHKIRRLLKQNNLRCWAFEQPK